MHSEGDPAAFERWCVDSGDLRAFREAVSGAPPEARARLREALSQPGPAEPHPAELSRDTSLAGRLGSPVALLRRQVRLEKLRLLDLMEYG